MPILLRFDSSTQLLALLRVLARTPNFRWHPRDAFYLPRHQPNETTAPVATRVTGQEPIYLYLVDQIYADQSFAQLCTEAGLPVTNRAPSFTLDLDRHQRVEIGEFFERCRLVPQSPTTTPPTTTPPTTTPPTTTPPTTTSAVVAVWGEELAVNAALARLPDAWRSAAEVYTLGQERLVIWPTLSALSTPPDTTPPDRSQVITDTTAVPLTQLASHRGVSFLIPLGQTHPLAEMLAVYPVPAGVRLVVIADPLRHGGWRLVRVGGVPEPSAVELATPALLSLATANPLYTLTATAEPLRPGLRYPLQLTERASPGQSVYQLLLIRQEPSDRASAEVAPALLQLLEREGAAAANWEYGFVDEPIRGEGAGTHVVRGVSPRPSDTAWPNGCVVYWQWPEWREVGLNLFVRAGWALAPPLTRSQVVALVAGLAQHLPPPPSTLGMDPAVAQPLFLLDPPESSPSESPNPELSHSESSKPETLPRARILWFASGVSLAQAEPILQVEYPAHAEAARNAALAELQEQARQRAELAQAQLAQFERVLVERFAARVQQTREQWHSALVELHNTIEALQAADTRRDAIAQRVHRFAGEWRELVEAVLTLNEELVQTKLAGFAELAAAQDHWSEAIARRHAADESTVQRLDAALVQLEAQRQTAEQQTAAAQQALDRLAQREPDVRTVLDRLAQQARDQAAQAAAIHQHLTAADQSIRDQTVQTRSLLNAIAQVVPILHNSLADARQTLARLTETQRQLLEIANQLDTTESAIASARIGWADALGRLKARLDHTRQQLDELTLTIHQQTKTLDEQRREVQRLTEVRERQLKQVQKLMRDVGVREQQLREEVARLERFHAELAAAQQSHDDWAKRLREQAASVEAAVVRLGQDRDGQLQNLRARLDAVARDLEHLARHEVGDPGLLEAPELAQFQAKLINEAKRFAPLSEEDYKRIWREIRKEKP